MSERRRAFVNLIDRRQSHGDDGITLIEVVVSMTIMSVFMAMFTGAMLQVYQGFNSSEATATAQSQTAIVFERLDREIRYARSVGDPEPDAADWYVEYLTLGPTGDPLCVSLWFDGATDRLRRNAWPGSGVMTTTGWNTLASGVALTAGGPPFVVDPGGAGSFRRLQVTFTARAGTGRTSSSNDFDVVFTALNSVGEETPGTNGCTAARQAA